LVPSWHTTVVELLGGTTTVVFAGGGGLELLIQPLSNPAAMSAAAARTGVTDTFIVPSSAWRHAGHHASMLAEAGVRTQRRISSRRLSAHLQAPCCVAPANFQITHTGSAGAMVPPSAEVFGSFR
jgi:hypothetical protein